MTDPDLAEGGYVNAEYWLVRRVQVGHGFGLRRGDEQMSDTVSMDLWCYDLDKPGRFAMHPEDAKELAHALLDSAQQARRMADG